MSKRIKITIEYDLENDDATADSEMKEWLKNNVDFIDIATLARDDESIFVQFEVI